ncbi:MAG: putative C-S lyase [Rhodobacteraceae bacterium]|uniref:cysteine-S-conjugate beta-lyase n=1 Tax=Salipiger profundus TaxID=1229727 RepID=A0A1U7D244_9RHOB|nr:MULTISPECIES: PatB family C-S lyase [Salipiger]APX22146.1 cystathione beta-lyase [Salipiger profundus]MAB05163.1 putative C-S lyase [Paracoccaceae bacterium]GGA07802.1 aminotransferase [Salipiger profundus]SFC46654.1 cystathione beta-lyase [Salipiger profundus]
MNDLFNTPIDRRGSGSAKWDLMDKLFGVDPVDGLAMWTADSDYPTAPCVIEAVQAEVDRGIFGYFSDTPRYTGAVKWWMANRHDWEIEEDWIVPTHGLGNGVALCVDVWTQPDDHVVIFSPVYHEFAAKVRRAGRTVTECPLKREGDVYQLDLEDAQARLTGKETMLIWCSPQNPTGRVWSPDELRAVADFAERNGMMLLSDEVHHDLIYPGNRFVAMDVAAPDVRPRLVVLTAASKTFNLAGQRVGALIIPDPGLRAAMEARINALDSKPNALGFIMSAAAYSPEGAAWVDAQVEHLIGNRAVFDEAVNAIPGVRSLPLQGTYLAWVDFSGTGMSFDEFNARIRDEAKIAASPGPSFGTGGETCMRINLATTRGIVSEAGARLQRAFADLQ